MNKIKVRQWLNAPVDLILSRYKDRDAWTDAGLLQLRDEILAPSLNKLAVMAWQFIENDILDMFNEVIRRFVRVYRLPSELQLPQGIYVWQETMTRVYTLGALAVTYHAFPYVMPLVKQEPNEDEFWRQSLWARHSLTMLARAERVRANSLCVATVDFVQEAPYFLELFGLGEAAKERATDATCRFDFLQCMVTARTAGVLTDCYPSFGAYYKTRVEPLVVELLNGGPSRQVLPDASDTEVANLIADLSSYANDEFIMSGWSGREWNETTLKLIRRHASDSGRLPRYR